MNRQDKRGRSKGSPPFIRLPHAINDHPSFQALSPEAKAIYLAIRRRYNGINNGSIAMSVRDAAAICHCGTGKAHRALKMLESHGFIRITTPGLVHGVARRATMYRLTDEVDPISGAAPTRDFTAWKPPADSFPSASTGTPRPSDGTARVSSGTRTASAFHSGYMRRAIS
jgi:hypothetical protein